MQENIFLCTTVPQVRAEFTSAEPQRPLRLNIHTPGMKERSQKKQPAPRKEKKPTPAVHAEQQKQKKSHCQSIKKSRTQL